jgi:hypothetical protein
MCASGVMQSGWWLPYIVYCCKYTGFYSCHFSFFFLGVQLTGSALLCIQLQYRCKYWKSP